MSSKDVFKLFAMLMVAIAIVALYCYARVDLGMTLEEVNLTLEQWTGKAATLTVLIWSQIIVAVVMGLGYRIWRHRAECARAK